jgi:hypothetical protein
MNIYSQNTKTKSPPYRRKAKEMLIDRIDQEVRMSVESENEKSTECNR